MSGRAAQKYVLLGDGDYVGFGTITVGGGGHSARARTGTGMVGGQRARDEPQGQTSALARTPEVAASPVAQAFPVSVVLAAGNAAVGRLLGGGQVRRCGPVPCDCDDEERLAYEQVHRHADGPPGPSSNFVTALDRTGAGNGLPNDFMGDAQNRFGADFGSVRVHTDAAANDAADAVNAHAFTVGQDVYFARGQYRPETNAGRRLMAHELTHVVQGGGPRSSGSSWVSHPSDPAEREAEATADRFMADEHVPVGQAADSAVVHRAPPPAGAQPEDTPAKLVRLIRQSDDRETILKTCMEAAQRWDDVQKAWNASPYPKSLLDAATNMSQGRADAARVYAYLKFGELRLADKLYFAGIGAGTDKETILRLLPVVQANLQKTTDEFTASYGTTGGNAFGADYTDDKPLPNGTSSRLAGYLDDELSGEDLVKGNAMLAFGQVRPADEVRMGLKATVSTVGSIMTSIDVAAHGTPQGEGEKPPLAADYQRSYNTELRTDLRERLWGRDLSRAELVIEGKYTPAERIKIACEAWVVDTDMIWAALKDATPKQLDDLQQDWVGDGPIKKLIKGKLTISKAEANRIEAILRRGTSIKDRLLAAGIEVTDAKGVVKAAVANEDFRAVFATEYNDGKDFYRDFTNDGRNQDAKNWGGRLASAARKDWLKVAISVESEEGVRNVLVNPAVTDKDRAEIWTEYRVKLRELSAWSTIAPLLSPRDDLQAKSQWLKQRYDEEKGLWGDDSKIGEAAASAAFGDEKRELDSALGNARDPANLTPEERKKIGGLAAGAEAALDDFIKVRDQLDQLAIQIAGAAAGLIATALTAGAAGPVTAGLLAKAAMYQGVASLAAVAVVKQGRTTGAEAARAFAVGAAAGVTGTLTKYALKGLAQKAVDEAAQVGNTVAEQQFSSVGQKTMNAAVEGLTSNAVGGAVDTASRSETWRNGFLAGLGKTFEGAAVGGLQGALVGAAAHLFTEAIDLARAGKVREANEKMNALEGQVTPEQAAALRNELNAQMKEKLGKPPGRAELKPEQEGVLTETAKVADGTSLTDTQLKGELDVVSGSEPQASTVEGYIDEVDLGNGHSWKRKADGTWCRFSRPSRCGTQIPNAPAPTPQTRSRGLRSMLTQLENDLEIMRSHPDMRQMLNEVTAIEKLLDASDIDNAAIRLSALRRRVDIGLGAVAEGALNSPFGGDDKNRTTIGAPIAPTNTGPAITLDVNSPPSGDAIGQRLLGHVRDAIAKFNDVTYTERQWDAIRARPDLPGLRAAFRGSRIDEFTKLAVQGDPTLAHLISAGNFERGADFYDSTSGKWYDITTTRAWKAHVAKYGPDGFRLPTEVK